MKACTKTSLGGVNVKEMPPPTMTKKDIVINTRNESRTMKSAVEEKKKERGTKMMTVMARENIGSGMKRGRVMTEAATARKDLGPLKGEVAVVMTDTHLHLKWGYTSKIKIKNTADIAIIRSLVTDDTFQNIDSVFSGNTPHSPVQSRVPWRCRDDTKAVNIFGFGKEMGKS
jgi:hypothetical protein